MDHIAWQRRLGTDSAAGVIPCRGATASGRTAEPSTTRAVAVLVGATGSAASLFLAARWLAPASGTVGGFIGSLAAAVAGTVLAFSIGEWVVHRWIMHRPSRRPGFRLAFEHHHRAHHWINFPPDQYIQTGPVKYVPLWSDRLDRAATGRIAWAATIASHFAFYAVFALALVLLPAWRWTHNSAFAWSVTGTSLLLLCLFIHAHDAIHYPGLSPLERFGWFRWLDRHHYIHHIDTGANTNFLLPLGDLLFGTLRRQLTPGELRRWPTYEQARLRLVAAIFMADGVRLRETASKSSLDAGEL